MIGVPPDERARLADARLAGVLRPVLAGGLPVAVDGSQGDSAQRIDESLVGKDNVAAALDAGRGVVLALPHSGNWDMAGVWMVQEHGTFTTVAERLKPESLYRGSSPIGRAWASRCCR